MTTSTARSGHASTVALLFLCLFASQSALIAISPVLVDVAADLDVSTGIAGQLRTITGLVAGLSALALGFASRRTGLRLQLLAGAGLLATGSLASAVAPGFELLAIAQVPVGIGVALLTTASTLAAADWVPREQRTQVLSWALVGQPTAWIAGMPLLGLVGGYSWRLTWLTLPFAAAVAAAIALVRRDGEPPVEYARAGARAVFADLRLRRWLLAELLANAGWAGTLVYSGALFAESYGSSATLTGALLAAAAAAYVAGNLVARPLVGHRSLPVLIVLAGSLALVDTGLGFVRADIATSAGLLSLAAFAAGARTLVTSAFGLAAPSELRSGVMALRASTMQFGYFAGSIAGGVALVVGGYGALGLAMGAFFLAAAVTLASKPGAGRASAPGYHGFTGRGRRGQPLRDPLEPSQAVQAKEHEMDQHALLMHTIVRLEQRDSPESARRRELLRQLEAEARETRRHRRGIIQGCWNALRALHRGGSRRWAQRLEAPAAREALR